MKFQFLHIASYPSPGHNLKKKTGFSSFTPSVRYLHTWMQFPWVFFRPRSPSSLKFLLYDRYCNPQVIFTVGLTPITSRSSWAGKPSAGSCSSGVDAEQRGRITSLPLLAMLLLLLLHIKNLYEEHQDFFYYQLFYDFWVNIVIK